MTKQELFFREKKQEKQLSKEIDDFLEQTKGDFEKKERGKARESSVSFYLDTLE